MDAGLEGAHASCYGVNLAFENFGVVVGFFIYWIGCIDCSGWIDHRLH